MLKTIALTVAILGIIVCGVGCMIGYYKSEWVTITVTEKERVMDRHSQDGSVSSRYLIWSEDETFENTDTLLKGKFNSSDLYGQLKVGNTYDCEVYGWRNGFFSSYRNLVRCKELVDE